MKKYCCFIDVSDMAPIGSFKYAAKVDPTNFGEYIDGRLKRLPLPIELHGERYGQTSHDAEQKCLDVCLKNGSLRTEVKLSFIDTYSFAVCP